MKQIVTLLLLLTVVSASGQPTAFNQQERIARQKKVVAAVQQKQTSNTASKTTADGQRLIGQTYHRKMFGQWWLLDTLTYKYSGERSSKFDYNLMGYQMWYTPAFGSELDQYRIQIQCDTMKFWQRDLNTFAMGIKQHIYASYSNDNKIIRYNDYDSWGGVLNACSGYQHEYDAQGRVSLIHMYHSDGISNPWDTAGRKYYFYNAQGLLSKDSVVLYDTNSVWVPETVNKYSYDANGNMTGIECVFMYMGVWYELDRYELSYDNSNRVTMIMQKMLDSTGGWMDYLKDTFAYNSSTNYATFWEMHMNDPFTGMGWSPMIRTTRHINAAGLPDTMYDFQWNMQTGGFYPNGLRVAVYNSFNNPEFSNTYYYDNGVVDFSIPADSHKYYYELFTFTPSSAGSVQAEAKDIKLYPNPAKDEINLSIEGNNGNSLSIQITNASGQLVYSEQGMWRGEQRTISTRNLVPGVYFLQAIDEVTNTRHQQRFIKQ